MTTRCTGERTASREKLRALMSKGFSSGRLATFHECQTVQKGTRDRRYEPKGPTSREETGWQQGAGSKDINTVRDPDLPSGILGITIHQYIKVEVNIPNKKSMGHGKIRRQDSDGDAAEEETANIDSISSLYVAADINGKLVYKTLVKSITHTPVFNSSTETYIGLCDGINTKRHNLRTSRSRRACKGWQTTESGYTWTLADEQASL